MIATVERSELIRPLSPRQQEILRLVREGYTSRQIAEQLGLTTKTVDNYVCSAVARLGARNRTQASHLVGHNAPGRTAD